MAQIRITVGSTLGDLTVEQSTLTNAYGDDERRKIGELVEVATDKIRRAYELERVDAPEVESDS